MDDQKTTNKRSRSDSNEESKLPCTKVAKVVSTDDDEVQEVDFIVISDDDSETCCVEEWSYSDDGGSNVGGQMSRYHKYVYHVWKFRYHARRLIYNI